MGFGHGYQPESHLLRRVSGKSQNLLPQNYHFQKKTKKTVQPHFWLYSTGLWHTRGHGVHGDVAAGQLPGEGLGEALDAGLRGGVIALPRVARRADHGADRNDPAGDGMQLWL